MASSSRSPSPLLYSCIAYENTVLCEHTSTSTSSASTSNLASIILPKITHSTPEKRTYIHGSNHIHYIADAGPATPDSAPGLTYLVVSTDSTPRTLPFAFLVETKSRFLKAHRKETYASLPAYGAAAFNDDLKNLMQQYGSASPAAHKDAFGDVQGQIDDVRGIMTENIERVLERGERIDLLVEQTDKLGGSARDFRFKSRDLQRRMWWKNVRLMAMLGLVGLLLVYLFVGAGCGYPAFGRCF